MYPTYIRYTGINISCIQYYLNLTILKNVLRQLFEILSIHKPSRPGVLLGPTQSLGLIGSAVLTFNWYKRTDRQAKYIYIWLSGFWDEILLTVYSNYGSQLILFFAKSFICRDLGHHQNLCNLSCKLYFDLKLPLR